MMMNLLLVEDDKLDQRFISNLLHGLPVSLKTASNGREAIELSGNSSLDCVLLDYHLADTEIWSLLDYFVNRQIPVIVVSDYLSPAIESDTKSIGAIGALDKNDLSTQLLCQYLPKKLQANTSQ